MLNELEVTVEGEDTGGKEDEDGLALDFPDEALEKGACGQGLLAAAVLSWALEEEHREVDTAEDGMVADVDDRGDGLLMG